MANRLRAADSGAFTWQAAVIGAAMRLIELTTFHEPFGIATYAEGLIDAMRELGAEVEVLAPMLRGDARIRPDMSHRWHFSELTNIRLRTLFPFFFCAV